MTDTRNRRRYPPPEIDIRRKIDFSRRQAALLEKRTILCPICGYHLQDVYGREHVITSVKCSKCKFNEPIDLALFRTVRVGRNRIRHSFRYISRSRIIR